jgi:predicted deacylase
VDYATYAARLRAHAAHAELGEYGAVQEGGRSYPLFRLIVPGGPRQLVITAGFHGEEPAGPLTLMEHFPEVADYARSRGVGLRVYPCLNPSGFEDGTRYNRSGEKPNNDFIRYEVSPGQWVDELREGQRFDRWVLYDGGPKETRAIRAELAKLPAPDAALDIHQDNYIQITATYAYVFGPLAAYRPMVKASSKHAKVAIRFAVDDHHKTDECGLIVAHDGSVSDYYMRRGVPYTAALETTTLTPMPQCHAVNLIWVKGFIDLAAGRTG